MTFAGTILDGTFHSAGRSGGSIASWHVNGKSSMASVSFTDYRDMLLTVMQVRPNGPWLNHPPSPPPRPPPGQFTTREIRRAKPGDPPDPIELSRRLSRYLVEQKLRDKRRRARQAAQKDIVLRHTSVLAMEDLTKTSSTDQASVVNETSKQDRTLPGHQQKDGEHHAPEEETSLQIEADFLSYLPAIAIDHQKPKEDLKGERNRVHRGRSTRAQRPGSAAGQRPGSVRGHRPSSIRGQRPSSIRGQHPGSIRGAVKSERQRHRLTARQQRNPTPMPLQEENASTKVRPVSTGDLRWMSHISSVNSKYQPEAAQKAKSLHLPKIRTQKNDSPVESHRFLKGWVTPLFRRTDFASGAKTKATNQNRAPKTKDQDDSAGVDEFRVLNPKRSSFLQRFKRQSSSEK